MLTGRTPFRADQPSAVIHQILHTDPPDPRSLSGGIDAHLASLALRLLAKRPEDRFETAEEAAAALDAGERVLSLERRRRARRWLGFALIFSGMLVAALWFWAFTGAIQHVRVARDDEGKPLRIVEARFAGSREWVEFFTDFPPTVEDVTACDVFDPDGVPGSGDELVVIGVKGVWHGAAVVALDLAAQVKWTVDVTLHEAIAWPDCPPGRQPWICRALHAANVDDEAGDELIVAANHLSQYPARVSLVKADAQRAVIVSTFWHLGNVSETYFVDHFFEGGKPALVVVAQNNKLDGLGEPPPESYQPLPGEDAPRTNYDRVLTLMVLDPANLNGIGPPRLPQLASLRGDSPYAYAQFNHPYLGRDAGSLPIAVFTCLSVPGEVRDDTGAWMRLEIDMHKPAEDKDEDCGPAIDGRGFLATLDGVLTLQQTEPHGAAAREAKDWLRWDPIIQRGVYVPRPAVSPNAAATEAGQTAEDPPSGGNDG